MIHIHIDGLPKMANGGHGSWQKTAGERKKWKTLVAKSLAGMAPQKPFKWARVVFTRNSSSEPDFDGLVHGFKPLMDALVKFGILEDDSSKCVEGVYMWAKAPPKKGFVTIDISDFKS